MEAVYQVQVLLPVLYQKSHVPRPLITFEIYVIKNINEYKPEKQMVSCKWIDHRNHFPLCSEE